jgi:GT2 family glycosyltransferase
LHVTICVPTCERGNSIVGTLRSLLASTYADWDAVIVDQSRATTTGQAVRALIGDDPRFRYLRSTSLGSSAARNLALAQARGPLVAFTDDDCEVLPDWLSRLVGYYQRYPETGLLYGAVLAGPHDPTAGFIPTCRISRVRRLQTAGLTWREQGIGANMAGPLAVLRALGGFDALLGSGAPLRANLDGDLTLRVLKAGYVVLHVPEAVVLHHGFRSWQQGQQLMRGVGIGVGATYMKHVRRGDPGAVSTFLLEWLRCISWARLLLLRSRAGLGCFLGYGIGAVLSFRYPIDPRTCLYRSSPTRNASKAVQAVEPPQPPPSPTLMDRRRSAAMAWASLHGPVVRQLLAAAIGLLVTSLLLLLLLVPGVSTGNQADGPRSHSMVPGSSLSGITRSCAPQAFRRPSLGKVRDRSGPTLLLCRDSMSHDARGTAAPRCCAPIGVRPPLAMWSREPIDCKA